MAHLITWLRDHHALTVAAVEVGRRTLRENRNEPWAGDLEAVLSYLDDERRALDEVLRSLGRSPSLAKSVAGWLGEKLGRLKLNDRVVGYSPLSRLEEVEALLLAVTALGVVWRTLDELGLAEDRVDAAVRMREADAQLDRLSGLLSQVATVALVPEVVG